MYVKCPTMDEDNKIRKSLAVDLKTYQLLADICASERRSKIEQLKVLIEKEHARIDQSSLAEA